MIKAYARTGLLFLAAVMPAFAAEPAGTVKVSKGNVIIERSGTRLPAAVGTPVLAADRIRTGADGSIGIVLRDQTLLSAGPDSVVVIDRFAYEPVTQDGAMTVTVRKGTLAVETGKIAKRMPQSVDFRTPTSILGVRGTEFAIEVLGEGDD